MDPKTSVSFILNDQPVRVDEAGSMMSLNEWIRAQPGLTGTKRMCKEGGYGCCMVSASFTDPTTQKKKTVAINSVCIHVHIKLYTICSSYTQTRIIS